MVGRYSKRLIMNRGVKGNIEENTLTLTNTNGDTQSFEVASKGEKRKMNVESRGQTTFTYNFKNGVTVSITTPGETTAPYYIFVSEGGTQVYKGKIASKGDTDALIVALKEQTEKEPEEDPTALEGGKNRKKTIRRKRVSRKKPTKLSRRRKFTHSK
jgi:hypothetical protein